MKKCIISLISLLCLVAASVVLASDGALWAVKRSSTGVLEVGFDSSGNLVAPGQTTAAATITAATVTSANITSATIAGIGTGVQTTSVTNNQIVTIANKQVNVTGPTNAADARIVLTLPSAAQLGEFVRIRNVGTNALNVVYKSVTTNAVAVSKQSLLQAVGTSEWEVVYTTP